MTQKLLLQKSSGCVYHYTESLAADPDFVEYTKPAKPESNSGSAKPAEEPLAPAEPDAKAMAAVVLKRKAK